MNPGKILVGGLLAGALLYAAACGGSESPETALSEVRTEAPTTEESVDVAPSSTATGSASESPSTTLDEFCASGLMDAETYELMCGSGAPADDPVVEDPPDDAAAGALDIAVQVPNECLPIATIEAALPGLAIVEASSNEAPPRGTGFTGLACAYLLGGEDLDFIGYGWEDFNGNDYTQPIWSRRDDLGPEVFIARADGAIGCEIATRWGIQQSAIVTAGATNDEACSLVEVLWGLIDARQ